jgi:hypothetical protein
MSPARLVVRSGVPLVSSLRPRPLLDAAPRRVTPLKRPRCFLPRWNPYATGGLLLRARLNRSTVTPPPRRHCSGTLAPFSPALQRLPLTGKAPEPARPSEPWEPKPPGGLVGRCAHRGIYDRISSRSVLVRSLWLQSLEDFLGRSSDDFLNINAVGPASRLMRADFPIPHLPTVHGHF